MYMYGLGQTLLEEAPHVPQRRRHAEHYLSTSLRPTNLLPVPQVRIDNRVAEECLLDPVILGIKKYQNRGIV